MVDFKEVKDLIEKEDIKFIDLKTLDLQGRLHHITFPADEFDEWTMKEGIGFDGSSFNFVKVERSDMIQIPDLETMQYDIFRDEKTLSFFVKVHLTDAERTRFPQDVRFIAEKAEKLLQKHDIADDSWWAPEYEFYILENVEYEARKSASYYYAESTEKIMGNAYHACNPLDEFDDFRDEATMMLKDYGIPVRYHHHEVGRRGQQEIEMLYSPLLKMCDESVLTKYVLFNLAQEYGIQLTFMPKPIYDEAGSGLHLHMYLKKKGKNALYEKGKYANMNDLGRYFIGGILKHARALSALTNPSTNSYKRLVPGFEAPVAITYGQSNRSSAVRIPSYIYDPEKTNFEYRPPDATCNLYLASSAIVMAGIDGVLNKIDPTKEGYGPFDQNIFEDKELQDKINHLPRDLEEALDALEEDHDFLLKEDVFPKELITQWIKLKRQEVKDIATRPHPFEYQKYFNF
ncbi:MAG: type I glutamate--ammonia ligase [Acidobacteria bacterium]|nr:type I glutamate--ammonia ligase [Acidobacteriota bacterium]